MAQLIVLSDEWGRHPSSCQHLVRRLAARHRTIWVNTIGMRQPQLSRTDAVKIARHLRGWLTPPRSTGRDGPPRRDVTVITPPMWPGFRRNWQRRLNGVLIGRAVRRTLSRTADGSGAERRIVLATVPIAAALLDRLPADAWVYYRVDDFAAWPGLDGGVMGQMEQRLLARADRIVAASAELQAGVTACGRTATLLTHGVDAAHWGGLTGTRDGGERSALPEWTRRLRRPIVAFWGLIDARLDVEWLRALTDGQRGTGGSLVLVGPTQSPDPAIAALDGVCMPGALPYDELPRVAALADVLVMPYRDIPATRAMQPLKLKEYLATAKPVVVRSLPATREWSDAADVVDTADVFARTVAQRARDGVPESQMRARRRLLDESWDTKAETLEAILLEA